MKPNRNKNFSYLFFTLFFIGTIILYKQPNEVVMGLHQWIKIMLLELLLQMGFHYVNKGSKKKRKIKVYVDRTEET